MTDIVERLREYTPEAYERTMEGWDKWRKAIADGCVASWPRDAFESHLDAWHVDAREAADAITAMREDLQHAEELAEQYFQRMKAAEEGEAADEIERLREALEGIAKLCGDWDGDLALIQRIARAALQKDEGE